MKTLYIALILFLFIIGLGVYYYYYYDIEIKFRKLTRKKYKPGLCPITDGYNRPKIIKNFISLDLCQKLIDWASPRMKDAEVIAYDKLDSKSRNNKVAWMNKKIRYVFQ